MRYMYSIHTSCSLASHQPSSVALFAFDAHPTNVLKPPQEVKSKSGTNGVVYGRVVEFQNKPNAFQV